MSESGLKSSKSLESPEDCHYVDDNHVSNTKEFWRCTAHGWRTTHQGDCYGNPREVVIRDLESAARTKIRNIKNSLGGN